MALGSVRHDPRKVIRQYNLERGLSISRNPIGVEVRIRRGHGGQFEAWACIKRKAHGGSRLFSRCTRRVLGRNPTQAFQKALRAMSTKRL